MSVENNTIELDKGVVLKAPLSDEGYRDLLITRIKTANPGSENFRFDLFDFVVRHRSSGEAADWLNTYQVDGVNYHKPVITMVLKDQFKQRYNDITAEFNLATCSTVDELFDYIGVKSEYHWDDYEAFEKAIKSYGFRLSGSKPSDSDEDDTFTVNIISVEEQNNYGNRSGNLMSLPDINDESGLKKITFRRVIKRENVDTGAITKNELDGIHSSEAARTENYDESRDSSPTN